MTDQEIKSRTTHWCPMPRHARYDVTVGNIGTVELGAGKEDALRSFNSYVAQSALGRGRAAGESVVVAFASSGEPVIEFTGTIERP